MLYSAFLILIASSFFSAQAFTQEHNTPLIPQENKEILWLIEDTYEWENYKKGISTSTSQDTAAFILKGLDSMGYTLNFAKATGKRINRFLINSNNACISNRIKTKEREKFSTFSLAHDIYLGLQLYRRSQIEPLPPEILNNKGEIESLAALFKYNTDKVLAISSGISYGSAIDEQIKYLAEKNVFKRTGGSRLKSLAEMFFRGRVDYVIYYPTDMDVIAKNSVDLESYKLANTSPYILGHVTCSKGKYGNAIIQDIDKILKQTYSKFEFYYAHEKWVPTSDLPTLREYFIEVFGAFPENK